MSTRDPRVDAYIARCEPFARPILAHLRSVVHGACPKVEETLKWGSPAFRYRGPMCGMSAFQQHCALSFHKGSLVLRGAERDGAMGQFGRITRVADLPSRRVLAGYVKRAMALNEDGISVPRARRPVRTPADLAAALRRDPQALAAFRAFAPSHRREYVDWITEAKRDETRRRRVATALAWIAQGRNRHWQNQSQRAIERLRRAAGGRPS